MKIQNCLPWFTLAFALFFSSLQADEVKMKNGEVFNGRITYESDEMVKIEVAISASIKETKILARPDIASISKDSPDEVEFAKIEKLLPTASMVNAENYRTMLETGPDAFLKAFPDSKHVEKVKEIREIIAKELDQVERGALKVNDEWFSAQDRTNFKELVDSKIRLARMEGFLKGNNLNSYIAAMREYEVLEKQYLGTPAYPKAVTLALQTIPNLGRQLQSFHSNADTRDAEYQQGLNASTPEAKRQLIAARENEDRALLASQEKDKKEGIQWTQVNLRNKAEIERYIQFAGAQLKRIKEIDTAFLAKQAEVLVEVDKLISVDNLNGARAKLAEASEMGNTAVRLDSGGKKSSPKGGNTTKPGSYFAILNNKINQRLAEEKEKAKAKEEASKAQALNAKFKGDKKGESGEEEGANAEGADGAANAPMTEEEELAALTSKKPSSKAAPEEAAKGKTKGKSKATPSKKPSSSQSDEGDDAPRERRTPPAVVEDESGGFSMQLIVPIATVLLIVVVVVLKFLGIGGKKAEE